MYITALATKPTTQGLQDTGNENDQGDRGNGENLLSPGFDDTRSFSAIKRRELRARNRTLIYFSYYRNLLKKKKSIAINFNKTVINLR